MMSVYLDNCCYNRPYDDQEQPPKFDYTEWRKDKFNDMTAEELNNAAAEYGRLHHKN